VARFAALTTAVQLRTRTYSRGITCILSGRLSGDSYLRFDKVGVIIAPVSSVIWRDSVGSLLVEAGRAVSAGNARQASMALSTAVAYLEKARAGGDEAAASLLLQLIAPVKQDETERFSFTPGELEEVSAARNGVR
jgi:hypothetical protein